MQRPVSLHGLTPEELVALARKAMNAELRSRGATLTADQLEDLHGFLIERALRLAKRYDPERGGTPFRELAESVMRRRVTDWFRRWRGDARYGKADRAGLPGRDEGHGGRQVSVADPAEYAAAASDPRSIAELVAELEHDKLSTRARGTLHAIAVGVAEHGLHAYEVAEQMGKSRREFRADLARLREELRA